MFSPLVSWILSSSSSSSSEDEEEEEQSLDINIDKSYHENHNVANKDNDPNNNVVDHDQNDDHYLSSYDVDDNIPFALAIPNASPSVTVAFPTVDERNTITTNATVTATTIVTRPKRQRIECMPNYSSLVKQYQRLWTKQDEMQLLQGYLDYIKQHRRGTTTLQNDVALLYDHVKPKLNVDFNKNQVVEKLRRLKRKHKVTMDKLNLASGSSKEVSFKSLQDKAIFEISHNIWGNEKDQDGNFDGYGSTPVTQSHDLGNNVKVKSEQVENNFDEIDNKVPKRLRLCTNDHNNVDSAISIQGLIEETMKSCFSPLLKEELFNNAQEGSIEGLEVKAITLCCGELKEQRILEMEVYLNRLEILQGQIKARLEELRSG